ncbi:MAG: redoxin domain-containing protein [Myxococcota bacterium]
MRLPSLMMLALAVAACDGSAAASVASDPSPETPSERTATARTTQGVAAANVGDSAPSFELRDSTGTVHRLADYRGKIVVLEWTSPECPFVRRHYGHDTDMVHTAGALTGDDVVWLAIDSSHFNAPADSESWRARHSIPYPVLQDRDGAVGRRYGARTTPHMYVIDASGVLRYQGAIDSDPRGREDAPTNYVRGAVEALRAGRPVPRAETAPYGCTVKYGSS